jgi:MFS family permease
MPPHYRAEIRRAWKLNYWNIGLWSLGNGLAGTTLIVYLATELGVSRIGLGISLILTSRYLIGLLQLGVPLWIGRIADRKPFCLAAFLLSGLLLFCLPLLSAPGVLPTAGISLAALVILWALYHLMQYFGTIALLSWIADLVPPCIRGRFFGRRRLWTVSGEAVAVLACGLFIYWWQKHFDPSLLWIGYGISAAVGAAFMLIAVIPLWMMPSPSPSRPAPLPEKERGVTFGSIAKPFLDRRFLGLLVFGCWFSFSNGLTQTLQYTFPKSVLESYFSGGLTASQQIARHVLDISFFVMLAVQTAMRLGQFSVSPYCGRLTDRLGNRPIIAFCLLLTAQGPLFYFFSTPLAPWWFLGAWIVWIAYAGMNVALDNLLLKISPRHSNTPYIAAYFTVTGLSVAASTILGGYLFDRFKQCSFVVFGNTFDYNHTLFLAGWLARCLGLLALLLVFEPKRSE